MWNAENIGLRGAGEFVMLAGTHVAPCSEKDGVLYTLIVLFVMLCVGSFIKLSP